MKSIAIEGIDGSGKSTLAGDLFDRLMDLGYKVHLQHFPNYTSKTGKIIKEILTGPDKIDETLLRLLFAADRRETSVKWRDLDVDFIILDRYITSGIIYGQAKNFQKSWLIALDFLNYKAHYEFILRIPIKDAIERIMKRSQGPDQYDIDYELLIKCKELYDDMPHRNSLNALDSVEYNINAILEIVLDKKAD